MGAAQMGCLGLVTMRPGAVVTGDIQRVAPGPEGVEVGRSVDEAPGSELREAGGGVGGPREVPVPELQENDLRRRENDAPVDPSAPGAVVCDATTRHGGSSHPHLHHFLNSAHNIPPPNTLPLPCSWWPRWAGRAEAGQPIAPHVATHCIPWVAVEDGGS